MKKIIIVFLVLLINQIAFSQNGEASELIKSAKINFQQKKYENAIKVLNQAKKLDKYNIDIYFLYGEIYYELNKMDEIINLYTEASKEIGDKEPIIFLMLGNTQISNGDYVNAEINLNKYLLNKNAEQRYLQHVKHDIEVCKFAINAKNNPVPFNPENLGAGVNSKYDEYLPALNAEENTLVFTRKLPSSIDGSEQEDFYISNKNDKIWQNSKAIGNNVNTDNNEGAQSLSADGKYLFFTACNRPDGLGGCDIYLTKKGDNGSWTKPINIGEPINTEDWESQPSISPDSKTLYFTSNRKGGKGKLDIWKSTIGKDGKFGSPINLGDSVNTKDNEISPFIHVDNKTLYFSSDGKIGMGGFDLYKINKSSDSTWGSPLNLGYPINTNTDENSLIVNAQGNIAYYASNRENGYGGIDLYKFELYKEAQPQSVTYFKGKIFDEKTKLPLNAKFELIDLDNDTVLIEAYSNKKTGEFLICIPTDKNYMLNVNKEQYIFYSDNFLLKSEKQSKHFIKDIPLSKIEKGNKLVLKNIFFDTDSYNLKEESKIELRKLINFLIDNQGINIEIGGHTDNVGNDVHNFELSENRAKTVKSYLVLNKISENRLTYKGYGETQPIATNETEEGKSQNRRTEFIIK
jgi:outer membrane protein OmpA-like peptidoglycan-associated protein